MSLILLSIALADESDLVWEDLRKQLEEEAAAVEPEPVEEPPSDEEPPAEDEAPEEPVEPEPEP